MVLSGMAGESDTSVNFACTWFLTWNTDIWLEISLRCLWDAAQLMDRVWNGDREGCKVMATRVMWQAELSESLTVLCIQSEHSYMMLHMSTASLSNSITELEVGGLCITYSPQADWTWCDSSFNACNAFSFVSPCQPTWMLLICTRLNVPPFINTYLACKSRAFCGHIILDMWQ